MIPQQKIDEIIQAAQIQDVVGEVVRLKKRGVNLLGLCPFHNEKTPSFTVSPAKGIYKCFGCGKAGNSVNFIMEHDGLGYIEALRSLAEKYNIEWPKQENVNIDEEKKLKSEKESLQILNNWAITHFEENLWQSEEGKTIGQGYFAERGFRDDIIKKFKLGYSLNAWDDLLNKAKEAQFNEELILKSGLVKQTEQGKQYDAYRGRVIFPIHGASGKVIAFAGRQLIKDDKSPKYVNSPETILYHKSNELYGLFMAKNAIRQQDFCYLVEGYTDVISMHQAGIENVVASSGTSLTEGQIKLIKRQTENVTVLYDGDAAGIKASIRGIDMLLEQGLNVKVVLFPDGEDPDSYCKKVGSTQFNEYLQKEARDFILFKVNLLLKDTQHDPIKKATVSREIVESISLIPDGLKRSAFIKECANLLDMPEQVLLTELNKLRNSHVTQKEKEFISEPPPDLLNYEEEIIKATEEEAQIYPEKHMIYNLIKYGDKPFEGYNNAAQYIFHRLSTEEIDFELESTTLILNEVKTLIENSIPIETRYFVNHQNPIISKIAADALFIKYQLSEQTEKRIGDYIESPDDRYQKDILNNLNRLTDRYFIKLINHIQKEIKLAGENSDQESLNLFMLMHIEVKKKQMTVNLLSETTITH